MNKKTTQLLDKTRQIRKSWVFALYLSGTVTVLLFCIAIILASLSPVKEGDVPVYYHYARLIANGYMPYIDFRIEYLPGVIPFIALAIPFTHVAGSFFIGYCLETMLVLILFLAHSWRRYSWRVWLLTCVVLTPLIQCVFFDLDIFSALALYCAVYCLKNKKYDRSAILLAASTLIKTYPGVCIVGLIWLVPKHLRWRFLGIFCASLAAVLVPVAIAAPHGLYNSIIYHTGRPLEVGASGAAIGYVLHILGQPAHLVSTHSSWALAFPGERIVDALTTPLMLISLGLVSLAVLRQRLAAKPAVISTILVTIFILFFKVGSPQYSVVLFVLFPLVTTELPKQIILKLALRFVILGTTIWTLFWVFFNLHLNDAALFDQRTPVLALLTTLRALLLTELIFFLCRAIWQPAPKNQTSLIESVRRIRFTGIIQRRHP